MSPDPVAGAAMARLAAIEGWYTLDAHQPALLGTRCTTCGTYFFPPAISSRCRNPDCAGEVLEQVALSRVGRLWSYTNACYQPPEPYVSASPFTPFAIAAVELDKERMIVLGQVVRALSVEDLKIGMQMELALETLYSDGKGDKFVWKWQPAGTST
jgi:uncharacterized protein